jgi:hypothetical protein
MDSIENFYIGKRLESNNSRLSMNSKGIFTKQKKKAKKILKTLNIYFKRPTNYI